MKKLFVALTASVAVLVSAAALAASTKDVSPYPLGERSVFSDRAIADRIAPVGSLCVDGEECGSASAGGAQVAAGPRSGEAVYNAACMACHATGAAGAPKTGDKGAWASRLGKGMDMLVSNAINGINAMPAKGMCMDCSDEEIRASVEYMVGKSK